MQDAILATRGHDRDPQRRWLRHTYIRKGRDSASLRPEAADRHGTADHTTTSRSSACGPDWCA